MITGVNVFPGTACHCEPDVGLPEVWDLALHLQTKTSRPQWDGRKDSRGTTQVSRTRRLRLAGRFVLTNISLPRNAGIAVWTTKRDTFFTRTAQEGTSTDFGRVQLSAAWLSHISGGFCQSTFLCHSLYLIDVIISKMIDVSSPNYGWAVTPFQIASSAWRAVRLRSVHADRMAWLSSKSVIPYVRCSRSG